MSESPFVTVHRLLSEETEAATELRILIKDVFKITPADREVMRKAADELDEAKRCVATLYAAIQEREAALTAAKEQIAEHRTKLGLPPVLPFTSMGAAVVATMIPKGWT